MKSILKVLTVMDEIISKIVKGICIFSLAAVFVMFIANVFVRFVPIYNFTTTDELTSLFQVWIVFFGSQEMVREKGHFVVDTVTEKIKGKTIGKIFGVISAALSLALYILICYLGFLLVEKSWSTRMFTVTYLTQGFYYACIPISAFFMSIYGLRDLIQALMEFQKKDETKELEGRTVNE